MNKKIILIGFSFFIPWSFLGLWWDVNQDGMMGYIIFLVAIIALSRELLNTRMIWMGLAGHLVSGVVSWLFANYIWNGIWDYYFKPLSACQLISFITLLSLIFYGIAAYGKFKLK